MAVHKQGYRLPRSLRVAALGLLAILAVGGRAGAADKNAVLVVDANTGQTIYQSSADAPRHPASLAKMMTLYIVFEQIEQGRLTYQNRIKASANAAAAAPSKLGLDEDDEIALIDAIKALITKSANDVAVAVAEHIGGTEANFARLMTQKAAQLGMNSTLFKNASGLPNDEQVTTARDMVTLALRLQDDFPKHYPLFATRTFEFNGDTYKNHNSLLANYEGTDGLKTGYTQASGFNLVASVRRGQKHVIGAVFGGSSASARDRTMRTFLNIGLVKASHVKTRVRAPALVAARPKPAPERKVADVPSPQRVVRPAAPAKPVTPAAEEPPQAQTPTQAIEVARVRTVLVTPPRPAEKAPDSIEAVLEKPEAAPQQWVTASAGPLIRSPSATATERAAPLPDKVGSGGTPSGLEQQAAKLGGGPARPAEPITTQAVDAESKPRWSTQVQASAGSPGGFHVQIGAFQSAAEAERQLTSVRERAPTTLRGGKPITVQFKLGDKVFHRARFAGFDAQSAAAACSELKRLKVDCLVMKAE